MFDTALHRRVTLAVALVALVLSGASAGATDSGPASTSDVSTIDASLSSGPADRGSDTAINATVVHEGDRVVLRPDRNQTVRLRTDAEAGTMLEVELLRNGSLRSVAVAPVAENGTAIARFDLLGIEADSEVTLVVRHDDRKIAEAPGVVREISTEFVYEGDRPVLRPAENQTLRIRTDAEPGRELTVRIQTDTFVRTTNSVVAEDGTATATFDLSDVSGGTEFVASVISDSDEDVVEGVLVKESGSPTTTEAEGDGTGVTVAEGQLAVVQAENRRISVETDASPGEEVLVVAKASGQFLQTDAVTVAENGTATGTFDFSEVAAGTEFTVGVQDGGNVVEAIVVSDTATLDGEAPLTVRPGSNLTVSGETTADPGNELAVAVAGDEFVRTENATVREDGSFVATFELGDLEPGTAFEVEMAGSAALKSGPVEGEVLAETTTADESDPTFTTGTSTPGGGDDGQTDELGVPGFGVPAALVALVGALSLARIRQRE